MNKLNNDTVKNRKNRNKRNKSSTWKERVMSQLISGQFIMVCFQGDCLVADDRIPNNSAGSIILFHQWVLLVYLSSSLFLSLFSSSRPVYVRVSVSVIFPVSISTHIQPRFLLPAPFLPPSPSWFLLVFKSLFFLPSLSLSTFQSTSWPFSVVPCLHLCVSCPFLSLHPYSLPLHDPIHFTNWCAG